MTTPDLTDPAAVAAWAKGLTEGTTRAPWMWDKYGSLATLQGRAGEPGVYEYDTEVVEFSHNGGCGCRALCEADLTLGDPDAALIAAAPDLAAAVPALAEQLAAERAKLERVRAWAKGRMWLGSTQANAQRQLLAILDGTEQGAGS